MNIYAGNLNYNLSEDELREIFENYGEVDSVKIVIDRESGRSKGFGFIEMPNEDEAKEALNALNGSDLKGRNLIVNQARERTQNNSQGFNRRY